MSSRRDTRLDPVSLLTRRSICPQSRQSDQLLRHRVALATDLYSKDFSAHYGCVNAIEFSHGLGEFIASGGDDRRVLLWNVEKSLSDIGRPAVMKGHHNSNIFCIAFDINNKTAFSGGNDEQVIVHDLATGESKDVFGHEDAVYGISPDPTSPSVFASACDDGRILIYDTRDSLAEPFCLANYTSSMHSVMYNPMEPRLLVTANVKEGVGLWDVRKPKTCLLRYGGSLVQQSCMCVRFNQRGDQIVALRRRLPPVLYKIDSNQPVCEFDHSGYYNSCTMKSVCYAGDNDQYVLSGSDEFNLYMWAIPEDLSERVYINSAHMVLKGHRSIVNQVRFNIANQLIVSSGVEKVIKVWSPFKHTDRTITGLRRDMRDRPVYSHEEYINLVLQDGQVMSHDYSQESTEEDPRMMAFFDSLVQRELEGWSSDDSLSSDEEALYSRIVQLSQSDIDSEDSLLESMRQDEEESNFSPFTIAFASVMASQAAAGNDRFPRLNTALEAAERTTAQRETVTRDTTERDTAAERRGVNDTNEETVHVTNGDDVDVHPSADPPAADRGQGHRKDIAQLVRKKKKELREAMKQQAKYSRAKTSSSSSTGSDDTDSDTGSSDSSLNIIIGEVDNQSHKETEKKNEVPIASSLRKETEIKKQVQLKLKKLRNLRKNILNSESEGSDEEIKSINNDKKACNSLSNVDDKNFEKFKKLKRHDTRKDKQESKDAKARASPDLGPYLQQTAATIEVRRASAEERTNMKGKYFPNEATSSKGKHHKNRKEKSLKSDQQSSVAKGKCVVDDSFEESRLRNMLKSRSTDLYEKFKCSVKDPTCTTSDAEVNVTKCGTNKKACAMKNCDKCKLSEEELYHKCTNCNKVLSNMEMNKLEEMFDAKNDTICSECQNSKDFASKADEDTSESINSVSSETFRDNDTKGDKSDNTLLCSSNSKTSAKPKPSCSYSSSENPKRGNSDTAPNRNVLSGEENSESAVINPTSSDNRTCLAEVSKRKKDDCSDSEDHQPTWTEFKRFKNKLERAKKRYRKHKSDRNHDKNH